jgi:hypothetical protein
MGVILSGGALLLRAAVEGPLYLERTVLARRSEQLDQFTKTDN